MPDQNQIEGLISEWTPQEPPPGPLCVSPVYSDLRLIPFGLSRGRCMAEQGCHQLLIWMSSGTSDYPSLRSVPDHHPPRLTTFDMSPLWTAPNKYGMPQGLIYLLSQRLWELWKRPFALPDVDILVDRSWMDALDAECAGTDGLVCSGNNDPDCRQTLSGLSYVTGGFEGVCRRFLQYMARDGKLERHWDELLLNDLVWEGLVSEHYVYRRSIGRGWKYAPYVADERNLNWSCAVRDPQFSWQEAYSQVPPVRKTAEDVNSAAIQVLKGSREEIPGDR